MRPSITRETPHVPSQASPSLTRDILDERDCYGHGRPNALSFLPSISVLEMRWILGKMSCRFPARVDGVYFLFYFRILMSLS
jgi:hypothetical protein